MALAVVACGRSGGTADKWAVGPQTDQPLTPVFINAQTAVGEDRFLFSVITKDGLPASSPDTGVDIAFYDLGRSKDQPQSRAKGTFANAIPEDPSHGLYITSVTFPTTGDWGAELTVQRPGQPSVVVRGRFNVIPKSSTPGIGDPAPPSRTPTSGDVGGDLSRVTTDSTPDPSLYRLSVAQAVASHRPFVLVFSTPKYCTSRVCGPTLDQVKAARPRFPGVEVIHVEVVDPKDPLDAQGDIKPVKAVDEWGLPDEPWVFVVDKDGKVTAKFEGVVTEPELVDAVKKVAA